MSVLLDLQRATHAEVPAATLMSGWIDATLAQVGRGQGDVKPQPEITVRVVDVAEIQALNRGYRSIDTPTNVLSFPFEVPAGVPLNLLGDVVICADIVVTQAQQQHKSVRAHWCHLLVHGTLHLMGYDHIADEQALEMEALEIDILARLGFANPYELTDSSVA